MINTFRRLVPAFIVVIVVSALVYYFVYQNKKQINEQKTVEIEKEEKTNLVNDLVKKYQATSDWEKNNMYTVQLQNALLSGKPALFTVNLVDVYDIDNKHYVRFSSSLTSYKVSYYLDLECSNNDVVNNLISKEKSYISQYTDYAVIASISGVTKPIFSLKSSLGSEDEVEINVEPSEYFILKGKCLEIVNIDK